MDGVRHSTMFALRLEPQAIHIHEAGAGVVQKNCIRCHRDQISDPKSRAMMADLEDNRTSKKCWECHRDLPHGKISSLSSTPNGKIEEEEKPIPDWLKDKIEQEYLQIKK